MRYLTCYSFLSEDGADDFNVSTFDKFSDAVVDYTMKCALCTNVVLVDLDENKIIKHFSHFFTGRGSDRRDIIYIN